MSEKTLHVKKGEDPRKLSNLLISPFHRCFKWMDPKDTAGMTPSLPTVVERCYIRKDQVLSARSDAHTPHLQLLLLQRPLHDALVPLLAPRRERAHLLVELLPHRAHLLCVLCLHQPPNLPVWRSGQVVFRGPQELLDGREIEPVGVERGDVGVGARKGAQGRGGSEVEAASTGRLEKRR